MGDGDGEKVIVEVRLCMVLLLVMIKSRAVPSGIFFCGGYM